MFFNSFDGEVRKIFNSDKDKYLVFSWILFNTNYQAQEYDGLKQNECKFAYTTVEKSCKLTRSKLQRIVKELLVEGRIRWIFKSGTKYEESIILLIRSDTVINKVSNTINNIENNTVEHVVNQMIEGCPDTVNNTVNNTGYNKVNDTLSKNLSKNASKNLSNNSITELEQIEILWKSYPYKIGKSKAVKMIPKLIKQYSYEEIQKCIERYIYTTEKKRKFFTSLEYQNGSSFFKDGYMDYLDENYSEIETNNKSEEANNESNIVDFEIYTKQKF